MVWRGIRPILIGVPLVFAAWALSVLVLTVFEPPGTPVAVHARGGAMAALDAVIAAGGYILQVKGDTVVAIADDPGFVGRLYLHGALFVILADTGGCSFAPARKAIARSASASPI